MGVPILTTMRELDTRVNDGLHVRLLWCEHDGRISVAVTDTKTGQAFSLEVREGEEPADVFHHPFRVCRMARCRDRPALGSLRAGRAGSMICRRPATSGSA